MRPRFVRSLLLCLTILGLLAPRISAAVAWAAPGVQAVVICSGHGLQTLYLDPDGNPVAAGETQPDLCLLVNAADTAVGPVLPPVPARIAGSPSRPGGHLSVLSDAQAARPPPRGPPAA